MPITVEWFIESHVILLTNVGDITVSDLQHADDNVIPMLKSSSKPLVHIVIDDRLQTSTPGMRDMSKIQYLKVENLGWVITQQQNPIMRMIGSIVGQMMKTRFRFVNTLESGLEFLAHVDSTLPDAETLKVMLKERQSQI